MRLGIIWTGTPGRPSTLNSIFPAPGGALGSSLSFAGGRFTPRFRRVEARHELAFLSSQRLDFRPARRVVRGQGHEPEQVRSARRGPELSPGPLGRQRQHVLG